jgi:hypothetical protein
LYRGIAKKIIPLNCCENGIRPMSMGTVIMEFENKMADYKDYNITIT